MALHEPAAIEPSFTSAYRGCDDPLKRARARPKRSPLVAEPSELADVVLWHKPVPVVAWSHKVKEEASKKKKVQSRKGAERAMQLPIGIDVGSKLSRQSQIFEQIRSMIIEGRLRVGDSLPATRELSQQMGVSRNTTVLAYERLHAEGYIETRPSVGTFVSSSLPEASIRIQQLGPRLAEKLAASAMGSGTQRLAFEGRAQRLVNPHRDRLLADFWPGRPDAESFPTKAWSRHIWRRASSLGGAVTAYQDPAGLFDLRLAIADHLGPTRGIITDPACVLIVNGIQDGLNLIARLLVRPGEPVILEDPCYQGAHYVFESIGATLFPVPVDQAGIDTAELPERGPSVAYVTPSHQYPLGYTLSLERRFELLAWAARTNSFVFEDDYDSDFRYAGSPLTALKGLDRTDRVIYAGTFSKSLGAGLRIGYLVLPRALAGAARELKALTSNGQPWLEQAALADFMTEGDFERHLRRIRAIYKSRRDHLLNELRSKLPEWEILGSEAGMHIVCRLPHSHPSAADLSAQALCHAKVGLYGLQMGGASSFECASSYDRLVILGYACITERKISEAIGAVASLVRRLKSRTIEHALEASK
jgi:GntR family transcriptional regulator/MocR family aminotransferase